MATVRCPVCGKSFDPDQSESLPFCGLRCKQVDLSRWLGEQYGLPYESEEEPDVDGRSNGDSRADS